MGIKGFLIRHGEKVALGALILLLAWRLLAGGVEVPALPDLDGKLSLVKEKLDETAQEDPPVGTFQPYYRMVEPDWPSIVREAWRHPLGEPAEDLEFPEGNWMVQARPKIPPPGEIKFAKPAGLAAQGLPGAVKVTWRGAREWRFTTERSALGLQVQEGERRAVSREAARYPEVRQEKRELFQITSAGVVRILGFNISRKAVDEDEFVKVNEELLGPADVNVVLKREKAEAERRRLMEETRTGPTERGYEDWGTGPYDPFERYGPEYYDGPPGGYMEEGPSVPRAVDRTRRTIVTAFEFLDREVYPEYGYFYKVEAVGEVLRAVEPKNPEDFSLEELKKRPKVGDVLNEETDDLEMEKPVEVKSDVLIACRGGSGQEASIVIYKWIVNDLGRIEEATDRFRVRAGQAIGYSKSVSVRVPRGTVRRGIEDWRGEMRPSDMDMGEWEFEGGSPPGWDGLSPGIRREPYDSGLYDPGLTGWDMREERIPGGYGYPGGSPGEEWDRWSRGTPRRPVGGRSDRLGGGRRSVRDERPERRDLEDDRYDTITREVDFSTGMILLDIVTRATEITVPRRRTLVLEDLFRKALSAGGGSYAAARDEILSHGSAAIEFLEGKTAPGALETERWLARNMLAQVRALEEFGELEPASPAKEQEEEVQRMFARQVYRIVVMDRLKRLKEHYKMAPVDAEEMRRSFSRAFGQALEYPVGMEGVVEGRRTMAPWTERPARGDRVPGRRSRRRKDDIYD